MRVISRGTSTHGRVALRQIHIISGSALASVYNWSHDCISRKRRVEGKEEEEKASHWTLEFHSLTDERT